MDSYACPHWCEAYITTKPKNRSNTLPIPDLKAAGLSDNFSPYTKKEIRAYFDCLVRGLFKIEQINCIKISVLFSYIQCHYCNISVDSSSQDREVYRCYQCFRYTCSTCYHETSDKDKLNEILNNKWHWDITDKRDPETQERHIKNCHIKETYQHCPRNWPVI